VFTSERVGAMGVGACNMFEGRGGVLRCLVGIEEDHMIAIEIARSRVNLSLNRRSKINATVAVGTDKHNFWPVWSSTMPASAPRWQAR
jgi:hypothetical protein